MDKEGMLRLLAELNQVRIRFGVTAGPSPRVGAAAVAVEAAVAGGVEEAAAAELEGARGCEMTCEGCVWLVLRAFPWLSVLRREEALDHSWYDYRLTKGSIDEVGSGKRHTTVTETVETQS